MRTVEEIRERLKYACKEDVLGLAVGDLQIYLPEEMKDATPPSPPPTPDDMKAYIRDYLPFAFEKAVDHRGISANRSVLHLINWAWLGGFHELVVFAEGKHYKCYGVPVLKRFAQAMEVELPAEIRDWEDGEPCKPGCSRGCLE